ncbi:MAG TPA: FliH/SctL family protein [Planctomycetaceae bacterium]|jgi:flagellar assembly protein FliH|nr:FliH/SctL family protein [Planctomycetaceae bacterium]
MPQPIEIPAQTRLLKANDLRGLGSKVAFNFDDLVERSDAYVESVRKQVREMLQQAETDVATIRREAQERGVEQGRQEGLRQAAEQIEKRATELAEKTSRENLATTLPAMRAAAETLVVERERWLTEWETTAVRLAAAIAERLLKRRLDLNPDLAREMIRGALQLAVGAPQIKLRLHADDAAILGGHASEVVRTLAACGDAEIVPESGLTRGSCVIETHHGTIDARLETMLERIVSELLDGHD